MNTEPERNGDQLPEGWAFGKLQDIGSWRSGGTPSRTKPEYFGQGIPWVKSGDLPDGPIIKTDEQITQLGLDNSTAKLMPPGTICMALYGATIGKLGTMTFEAATNQATANLVPDERLVDGQYVFHYLMSERQNFIDLGQGGAQPNISQEIVRKHPIKLAPLVEQRRIVGKLELLLGKVSSSQQRLSRVPGLLKRFRQSVLAAACSGKLTADWREENEPESAAGRWNLTAKPLNSDELPDVPPTWVWRKIDDISERVSVGHVGPTSKFYCSSDVGIPFVRSQNVRPARLAMDDPQFITREFHDSLRKSQLRAGDILIVRVGANRGDTCKVPDNIGVLNCANIVFARPFPGISDYIEHYCQSKLGQDLLLGMTTGSAQGVLNTTAVAELAIPIPPETEQQEIVRRVESLFAFADLIESRLRQAQAHVDRLTQSLLAKAFRGELVPTEHTLATAEGREYEPASELLARIQAEQNSTSATVKPKRKRVPQSRGSRS